MSRPAKLTTNPGTCPECGYQILTGNNWRRHMKDHHGWRYDHTLGDRDALYAPTPTEDKTDE